MDIFMSVCDPKKDFVEGTMTKKEYLEKQLSGEQLYPSELVEQVDEYYSDDVVIEANCGEHRVSISYDAFCSLENKEHGIFQLLQEAGADIDDITVISVSNAHEVQG